MLDEYDHEHLDKFYYCQICMQYQYPESDKIKKGNTK